tara:strand:+ start:8974 stop:9150 length:177 start_codon:yes stop_codon:yes gene_type:complete
MMDEIYIEDVMDLETVSNMTQSLQHGARYVPRQWNPLLQTQLFSWDRVSAHTRVDWRY